MSSGVDKIIQFVEQKLGNRSNQDGVIQQKNAAEYSLFMAEMGRKVSEEGLSKTDLNNMIYEAMGLELPNKPVDGSEPAGARRAPGGSTQDINIEITINIDIDIVTKAASGDEESFQTLVNMLIAELTREGGSFEAFMIALIQAYCKNAGNVDFSTLEKLIKDLQKAIETQSGKIDSLTEEVQKWKEYFRKELSTLYRVLVKFLNNKFSGLDQALAKLENIITTGDLNILKELGRIASMITNFKNAFDSFTDAEKERYKEIMSKFGDISGDLSTMLSKLKTMELLLNAIKADTSATKENTEKLIQSSERIEQAVAKVQETLDNLEFPEGFDTTNIEDMLNQILTNQALYGAKIDNIEEYVSNFEKYLEENLKPFIQQAVNAATENINGKLEIKSQEILDAIGNIKPGEVDLSEILNLLKLIDGKVDNVLANQSTMMIALTDIRTRLQNVENKVIEINGRTINIENVLNKVDKAVSLLHNCDCEKINWDELWKKIKDLLDSYHCCCGDNNEGTIGGDVPDIEETADDVLELISAARSDNGFGEEETTGVSKIQSNKNGNAKRYDLGGREVNPNKPGLQIVNGKKFINKRH